MFEYLCYEDDPDFENDFIPVHLDSGYSVYSEGTGETWEDDDLEKLHMKSTHK